MRAILSPFSVVAVALLVLAPAGFLVLFEQGTPESGEGDGTSTDAIGPAFAEVPIPAETDVFEPSIQTNAAGKVFVCAPTGLGDNERRASKLWRSDDGGATFIDLDSALPQRPRGAAVGGGDCDIAVGSDGTLYYVDLNLANVAIAVSTDEGASWAWTSPVTSVVPGNDRMWLAAGRNPGEVYLTFNNLGTGLWVLRSTTAGKAFETQTLAVSTPTRNCICPPGGIAVSPADGSVALIYVDGNAIKVAFSKNDGQTFGRSTVRTMPEGTNDILLNLAIDGNGVYYATWSEVTGGSSKVFVAASLDGGKTWGRPLRVSTMSGPQRLPWVATNAEGRVAVQFAALSGNDWHLHAAVSENLLSPAPSFGVTRLTSAPALTGEIRRPLEDFNQVAFLPSGKVTAAWGSLDGGKWRVHTATER